MRRARRWARRCFILGTRTGILEISGKTSLYFACEKGHVDAARLLLDNGAAVDRATEDGFTPLLIVCQTGDVEAARLLLDRSADVHRRADSGHTCLNGACCCGHVEVVQLLLDNGAVADLNVADNDGDTPMANAKTVGHTAVVDLLEKYASDS